MFASINTPAGSIVRHPFMGGGKVTGRTAGGLLTVRFDRTGLELREEPKRLQILQVAPSAPTPNTAGPTPSQVKFARHARNLAQRREYDRQLMLAIKARGGKGEQKGKKAA